MSATLYTNNVFASPDENCDPSYPDVCIVSPPPDLNCDDVPYNDIKVVGDDPHGFDREGDGIGCES
jgi:micrococcal nuclease